MKESKSVVSLLKDRELSIKRPPYFTSLKIASQLIRSDKDSLYSNSWRKSSKKEISYDSGNLYFMNYKQYCPINACNKKQTPIFKMEKDPSKKRIADVISYSGTSVYKDIKSICQCGMKRCLCLSPYLLTISEDNWLCQYSSVRGKLMKQIYVNLDKHSIKFRYCDWDIYGERFTITTTRTSYPFRHITRPTPKNDVMAYIAVFTTFPIEFLALMEIKRSVFGQNVTAVSISNRSLIIGVGSTHVVIYNFDDFLKEGTLTPYKLGDPYGIEGEIGSYPTGLPINFTYNEASPVLFKVRCMSQIVRFGGYPYHYITIHPTRHDEFKITAVETDIPIQFEAVLEPGFIHDPADTVVFHPDQSNRIIFKKDNGLDVYKISIKEGKCRITKLFTMGRLYKSPNSSVSLFGRPIKPFFNDSPSPCIVLSSDYEDELEIFAVLTKFVLDDKAFVLLYDSHSGEELRSIELKGEFCESRLYQIYVDLFAIVIIEKDLLTAYKTHVYIM